MADSELKTKENNVIPVFFNADDNYAVPTYITIFSMMQNYRGKADIYAFILVSDDFSEKSKALLNSLCERFDKLKIRIINAGREYDEIDISQDWISSASMYRLKIPRIAQSISEIQIDKCIYLDSDLIVEGNIAKLFKIDINDYYIAGVADRLQIIKKYKKHRKSLGMPSVKKYINSGVLLINVKAINENEELRDKLENAAFNESYRFKDQDAINVVLYDKIKLLNIKYNASPLVVSRRDEPTYKLYGRKKLENARKNPVIVHYITRFKPWNYKTEFMAQRWWKYVRMQERAVKREYIKPFLKEQGILPLNILFLLAIRNLLRRTGRYYIMLDKKSKFIKRMNEKIKNQ